MEVGFSKAEYGHQGKACYNKTFLSLSLSPFWVHWVFTTASRLSLVAVVGVTSLVAACRLLTAAASLMVEHGF